MMTTEHGLILVRALYSFTGKNNDELCFKKGDIIVVTQKEEGGWWEGTLNENTGWFPSNYVKEYKPSDANESRTPKEIESPPLSPQQSQQQTVYRNLVMKDILDSERSHVIELRNILNDYLVPLQNSDLINTEEYSQLTGNFDDLASGHGKLLSSLEEQFENPYIDQRIGGAFLKLAPELQLAHTKYISNHPKAVCVIEKYKDELNSFMECQGAQRPGTLVLTTALSQPFRRLDKYPSVLQEYQRHIDDAHPDRGDTQRSVHVFRELASSCSSIRRQKQLELEVLTNKIHGWEESETLSILGDIIHMRSVALLPDNRDRYLVLFPNCLVVLALSSRASSFIFEGKYPLSGLAVNRLDDGPQYKNAFEITGAYVGQLTAVCQSKANQQEWVDILRQQIRTSRSSVSSSKLPPKPYSPPVPPPHDLPSFRLHSINTKSTKPWSMSCLRPSPPLRPGLVHKDDKRLARQTRKKDEKWYEEDALLLRVIEAYCTSAKARYTVNSTLLDSPQVLIAEDEKIIVEEKRGNQLVHEEKSLVDTVYALKDELGSLLQKYQTLKDDFDSEKRASQNMRNIILKHILAGRDDLVWELEGKT